MLRLFLLCFIIGKSHGSHFQASLLIWTLLFVASLCLLVSFNFLEQTEVEVEDVRKAQPDAIAHASAGIISRLEESGDKLTEALKSLCWRHNGIQAEVNSCDLTLEAVTN